jgi:hypothetical protein
VSNCSTASTGGDPSKSAGLQARTHTMEWLELGDRCRFSAVTSMVPVSGGFDLSAHTCGMLTGELLSRSDVVYDFSKRRIAVLGPGAGSPTPRVKL